MFIRTSGGYVEVTFVQCLFAALVWASLGLLFTAFAIGDIATYAILKGLGWTAAGVFAVHSAWRAIKNGWRVLTWEGEAMYRK
jgi:hypothetical protein